jgi:hypothetical protein
MLKVMTYKISHVTRLPLGSFDMDVTLSFVRIIMVVELLLCWHQGVPPSGTCIMAAMVLLTASYYIKTTHGVSSENYYGPRQGSHLSPTLCWVLISCLMFIAMDLYKMVQNSATLLNVHHINVLVTALLTLSHQWLQLQLPTLRHAQRRLYCKWHHHRHATCSTSMRVTLWSTGGALLELSKCFFYILSYKFHKNVHQSYYPHRKCWEPTSISPVEMTLTQSGSNKNTPF